MTGKRILPVIECPGCGRQLTLIRTTYKNSHYECDDQKCEVMDIWYNPHYGAFRITREARRDSEGSRLYEEEEPLPPIPACPRCASADKVVRKGHGWRRTQKYYCRTCQIHFSDGLYDKRLWIKTSGDERRNI